MSGTSSPLGQLIQRIMREHAAPMSLMDLQQRLRLKGQATPLIVLREILSDQQMWTALADEYFLLREFFTLDSPAPSRPQRAREILLSLPRARDDYVVLDIETNGLQPDQHQIIQIAALRIKHSDPVVFRTWDVRCAEEAIDLGLRRKLHLDDIRLAQIAAAPPLAVSWPDILAFLGDAPLVIHNARFDLSFLRHHDPDFDTPVVDTLELALLLFPRAPNHRLSTIAELCALPLDAIDTSGILGVPAHHRIAADTLHDAITDVLVLAATYRALLQRWDDQPIALRALRAGLLPAALPGVPIGQALGPILPAPEEPLSADQAPLLDASAAALLTRFAETAGLSPRPSQAQMVAAIDEALTTDSSRLIEAPTGTGKTLGYLIPAVWAARQPGRRIAVATAYKNLQDQLEREVERFQAVAPFRAAVIKGAGNYLCLRDFQLAVEQAAEGSPERGYVLAFLAGWSTLPDPATLDEIPFWLKQTFPETASLLREVAANPSTCTEHRCAFYAHCHLFAARRRAEQADIIVMNQAVWLSGSAALPAIDALIIDEAHNLEDMATSALQQDVGEHTLRATLSLLHVPETRRGLLPQLGNQQLPPAIRTLLKQAHVAVGQSLRLLDELRHTFARFVAACDATLDANEGATLRLSGRPAHIYPVAWQSVQQALDQLWGVYVQPLIIELDQLAAWVAAQDELLAVKIAAVRDDLAAQATLLDTLLQARRTDLITWLDVDERPGQQGWGFCAAPLSVAGALAERYRQVRSVILTSATLTTGPRDFGFFIERLGLREVLAPEHALTLAGVLPYAEQVVLGLPSYLTYTPAHMTQQSFIEELGAELLLLLPFTEGRSLVLFTARRRLEQVHARTGASLEERGIPVLAQLGGVSRHALIEEFRTHGHAALYGLKSFWEGIDVPGQALSFVIMEKLPYPALNDPIHAARREAIARQNGREFQEYLFPLMVLQFKQGFGRLLRAPQDRGAVIVYDKRISRKSYLPALLGALPGYQPRDLTAERSRRAFYALLATRLPELFDLDAKGDVLDSLPDTLFTDLEVLIEQLALPDPLPSSDYPTWRPHILTALKALYGFDDFRSPAQEEALRAMLSGDDVLAVLPTGAGKSICFQLPALLRRGTTVICSPLIALMKDQVDKLYEKGIEVAAALMSGQSAAEREEILSRLRAGRLRLLYLAPERLRDPVVLAALAEAPIRQIVADEAHCVALWGPSFRPDFLMLPQVYTRLRQRPPVAAFTATATPAIADAIVTSLAMNTPAFVQSSIDRPELRLLILDQHRRYHRVRSKTDQIRQLLLLVQTAVSGGEALLIYVSTVKEAEYLARLLQVAGIAARAYHGRMDVQERATISEQFMDDLLSIVVCTKAFGMGIDKPDIRYVVHFNIPGDLESYFQEIGRAGRDGRTAYAVLLHHPSDERIHEFFIAQSQPNSLLLRELWHWIGQQPEEWILPPQVIRDQFEIDELELRRSLYLLEQGGLIRRGPDVTLRGSVTLLRDWQAVLDGSPAEAHPWLENLRTALPGSGWGTSELVVADVAAVCGIPAPTLESLLIAGAVRDDWLYRPWEKGYHITRLVPADTPLPPVDMLAVEAQQEKLHHMRAFVRSSACRWQALRRYFGEAAGAPCGTCDRCDAEQRYPWSGKTGRDVPDVSDFLDLPGTLLHLAWWNEQRINDGRNPFSRTTLVGIIRGDEYALMHGRPPGPATEARRQTLRNCPYWGVCRTLRRSARELQALLDRLLSEGYVAIGTAILDEYHSYAYVALTAKGHTQRLSTTRLIWDTSRH